MKPGVSFVIRVRNEELFLGQCLKSLKTLSIPYECIVILHKCTDSSRAIAESASASQPICIYETDQNLSRAGYENLITPVHYKESLASFYSWCFSKAQYNWKFKWDADFTMSAPLLEFLNKKLVLDEVKPVRYKIPCEMSPSVVNHEAYLFNCLVTYTKYIFWEVPAFVEGAEMRQIEQRIFTIPHTFLKGYWREPAWFIGKDAVLESRYKKLVELCGPEPTGASRAQCPDCDPLFFRVQAARAQLEAFGIYLVE